MLFHSIQAVMRPPRIRIPCPKGVGVLYGQAVACSSGPRPLGSRTVSLSASRRSPEVSRHSDQALHASASQHAAYSDADWADQARVRLLAVPLATAKPGGMPIVTFVAQSMEDPVPDLEGRKTVRGKLVHFSNLVLNKASQVWIGLGKPGVKSPGDWKRRTYALGEKMMDRIEYQEWSLKNISHVMGPHFQDLLTRISSKDKSKLASVEAGHIPLLYPAKGEAYSNSSAFSIDPLVLLHSLGTLAENRVPHHRRLLFWSVVAMPLTIPIAILPVIPNLPFFYLCWRAFSHWQAMRASSRILFLLGKGRIVPTPSAQMEYAFSVSPDELAKQHSTKTSREEKEQAKDKATSDTEADVDKRLILQPVHITQLAHAYSLDHQSVVDLTRARTQLIGSLEEDDSAAKSDKNKVQIVHHMRTMAEHGERVSRERKQ